MNRAVSQADRQRSVCVGQRVVQQLGSNRKEQRVEIDGRRVERHATADKRERRVEGPREGSDDTSECSAIEVEQVAQHAERALQRRVHRVGEAGDQVALQVHRDRAEHVLARDVGARLLQVRAQSTDLDRCGVEQLFAHRGAEQLLDHVAHVQRCGFEIGVLCGVDREGAVGGEQTRGHLGDALERGVGAAGQQTQRTEVEEAGLARLRDQRKLKPAAEVDLDTEQVEVEGVLRVAGGPVGRPLRQCRCGAGDIEADDVGPEAVAVCSRDRRHRLVVGERDRAEDSGRRDDRGSGGADGDRPSALLAMKLAELRVGLSRHVTPLLVAWVGSSPARDDRVGSGTHIPERQLIPTVWSMHTHRAGQWGDYWGNREVRVRVGDFRALTRISRRCRYNWRCGIPHSGSQHLAVHIPMRPREDGAIPERINQVQKKRVTSVWGDDRHMIRGPRGAHPTAPLPVVHTSLIHHASLPATRCRPTRRERCAFLPQRPRGAPPGAPRSTRVLGPPPHPRWALLPLQNQVPPPWLMHTSSRTSAPTRSTAHLWSKPHSLSPHP